MYSNNFKKFVSKGVDEKYFIGTGNPSANILVVGKESAINPDNFEAMKWYKNNALDWQTHIKDSTCEILEYSLDKNNPLRKGWGRNTWSKYQKLNDFIFDKESKPLYVDFLKDMFATEINDSPSKNTADADKSILTFRKRLFKESEFIQQFPVVVLACSNYIRNNNQIREIDLIFNVTYDGDNTGRYLYNKGNWFYLHYNAEKTKLVIHTRQLSGDVSNEMLKEMGTVIKTHLLKIHSYSESHN